MTALPAIAITPATAPIVAGPPVALVGGERDAGGLPVPMQPSASQLFAPRGACIHPDGSFWVSDTGHHRLLGWPCLPHAEEPAAWLIGQPDFECEGRNAGGEPTAATVNVPTGIAACGDGLVVADAWNHRVLIWRDVPACSHQQADIVLGQADFSGEYPNRGTSHPAADTLHWPFGVLWHEGSLYVADTGNRRVLIWEGLPDSRGQPADRVLGQGDFCSRDENGGGPAGAVGMRWPHALTIWQDRLCVADAGNNRIMVYATEKPESGAGCEFVLGQPDVASTAHMRGRLAPSADTLNMPYGLTPHGEWLLAADTASSRLLAWHCNDLADGASALALHGQPDFDTQGDNRWGEVSADSLCWPYAVSVQGDLLVTADTGNSRVLIHRLAL